jgi:hypothetical protein
VTQCGSVMLPTGGETSPVRGKGGDDASWVVANLTWLKNEGNLRGRFTWYKWMVKI